jgi:hypothetical protein
MSAAVEAVSAAAAASGAFGVGVVRYTRDIQEGDPCLPPGAKLVQVGRRCMAPPQYVAASSPVAAAYISNSCSRRV